MAAEQHACPRCGKPTTGSQSAAGVQSALCEDCLKALEYVMGPWLYQGEKPVSLEHAEGILFQDTKARDAFYRIAGFIDMELSDLDEDGKRELLEAISECYQM